MTSMKVTGLLLGEFRRNVGKRAMENRVQERMEGSQTNSQTLL